MSKTRVVCPECGHRHTLPAPTRRVTTVGVRARRTGKTTFNYEMVVPASHSPDDDGPLLSSPLTDLMLCAAFCGSVGALLGSLMFPVAPDFSPHAVVIGGMGGIALGWGWLLAEHNQRLKRVLPWFIEQRQHWQSATQSPPGDGVTLTVDHRYRDSYSEAGRSVNYFGTLPVDVERFNDYARAAVRGDSLAIAQWVGSGKPFSRNEYDALLALLRRADCVVNVPGKGNRLTSAGGRAFKNHLRQHPPTPPRSV